MIGAAGIEPASTAYKTGALPLDEAPESGNNMFPGCLIQDLNPYLRIRNPLSSPVGRMRHIFDHRPGL